MIWASQVALDQVRTPPAMACLFTHLFLLPLSFLSFVDYLRGPFNLRGKTPVMEESIRAGLQPHPQLSTLESGPTGVTCRCAGRVATLQSHQPARKCRLNLEPKRVPYWPPSATTGVAALR